MMIFNLYKLTLLKFFGCIISPTLAFKYCYIKTNKYEKVCLSNDSINCGFANDF